MTAKAKPPPVSIILPTYNRPYYLAESIGSVLEQTFTDFELLIVDDASTDPRPRQIAADFARRDTRIRTICLPENLGLSGARNRGIEQARGKYITFQDDDDLSTTDRLAPQVAFLNENPDFASVKGAFRVFSDESSRLVSCEKPIEIRAGAPIDSKERLDEFQYLFPGPPMSLMRREVLHKVNGFRPWFVKSEVWDLALRILEKYNLAALPDLSYHYRQHHLERLTNSVDIHLYYGAAFLCALYRKTGRKEPIGAKVTPASLAPAFKELPEFLRTSILGYALGRAVPAAIKSNEPDTIREAFESLLSFVDQAQMHRLTNFVTDRLNATYAASEQSVQRVSGPTTTGRMKEEISVGADRLALVAAARRQHYALALEIYRGIAPSLAEGALHQTATVLLGEIYLCDRDFSTSAARAELTRLLTALPLSIDSFPSQIVPNACLVKELMLSEQFGKLTWLLKIYACCADTARYRKELRRLRFKALKYSLLHFKPGYWLTS